ncbi:hypothetical protein E3H11_14815 [Bradyrhizobium brasilense]|nr:hypothetical protein [Bradyrhizobium brasilense]
MAQRARGRIGPPGTGERSPDLEIGLVEDWRRLVDSGILQRLQGPVIATPLTSSPCGRRWRGRSPRRMRGLSLSEETNPSPGFDATASNPPSPTRGEGAAVSAPSRTSTPRLPSASGTPSASRQWSP